MKKLAASQENSCGKQDSSEFPFASRQRGASLGKALSRRAGWDWRTGTELQPNCRPGLRAVPSLSPKLISLFAVGVTGSEEIAAW